MHTVYYYNYLWDSLCNTSREEASIQCSTCFIRREVWTWCSRETEHAWCFVVFNVSSQYRTFFSSLTLKSLIRVQGVYNVIEQLVENTENYEWRAVWCAAAEVWKSYDIASFCECCLPRVMCTSRRRGRGVVSGDWARRRGGARRFAPIPLERAAIGLEGEKCGREGARKRSRVRFLVVVDQSVFRGEATKMFWERVRYLPGGKTAAINTPRSRTRDCSADFLRSRDYCACLSASTTDLAAVCPAASFCCVIATNCRR